MQIKAGLEWVVVNRAQWDRRAALNERVETIFQKLAEKRNCPPDSFEVKQLIGEYGFVMKQITRVQDETSMMQYLAWIQSAEPTKSKTENQYGEGTAEFMKRAIWAFYGKMDMGRS